MQFSKIKVIKNQSGQAIVEAIVALSVLTIGYMAILALLNRSLSITQVVSDQNIATYLASEGVEITKNIVDASVNSGNRGATFKDGFQVGSYEVSYGDISDSENPGLKIGNTNDRSAKNLYFDETVGYNYQNVGAETRFRRTVIVLPADANRINIASIVEWDQKGGGINQVRLEDYFFDWR